MWTVFLYVGILLHYLMFKFSLICVVKFLSRVFFMFTFRKFGVFHQGYYVYFPIVFCIVVEMIVVHWLKWCNGFSLTSK